ncbi:MAG: DNA mismatch repair protein MutS2 [Bacteroidetes bacterium]|nr:MAG: DNA mismatch repair protein MutS2 [Bacteroidota bacterium]
MIYPDTFDSKTGFDKIRVMLEGICFSPYAKKLASEIAFSNDFSKISTLINEAAEMKYILQFIGNFPSQDYYDLSEELTRVRLPGTFTDPDTMIGLRLSLITITDIIRFLKRLDAVEFPRLSALIPANVPDPGLIKKIEQIIDEKAGIRDKASEKLYGIRREISSKLSGADRRINQILATARKDGLTGDDTELTIRNGRLVIPVSASNKRKISGYIHDTSATGQTVYIEPAEVFEINNEVQNLRIEERQEVIRILTEFTDFLRPHIPGLSEFYRFLGEIDFIRAKAGMAIKMDAVKPMLTDRPVIKWQKAIHPLLNQSLKQQGRKIVPLDIELNSEQRILIISGPNAGGKSVCLKTAGLLQYMLQCGLLIPVGDDSEAGIFSSIFLEIGDEQSLENDLSTYSSHLIHIRTLLENVNNTTLFLIDEFGAGTEPQLGGAMAEASLEALSRMGGYGIVTTHYTNLKLMAGKQPGIVNGAMLYDTKAMTPLFRLSIGKPGSSFAFEIARKIGFPSGVLEAATGKISTSQLDFEHQLAQLEVDKKFIDQKTTELKVADETLASLVGRYEQLLNSLETRKQEILREAKTKAQQILDNSNRIIEKTIREIKENKAEKESTRKLREMLDQSKEEILSQTSDPKPLPEPVLIPENEVRPGGPPPGPLRAGSFVRMEGQEAIGKIEEIRGKQVTVQFGSLRIRTKMESLIAATHDEIRTWEANQKFSKPPGSVFHQLNDKMADFKMSIDIRGKKAEEAHEIIARYIDQAILLRVHEVRILHGKGDGILRNILQSYLRDVPEVARYEDESIERGGHGVTLVYFK